MLMLCMHLIFSDEKPQKRVAVIVEKSGDVVGMKAVNDDHEIMMITDAGIIIQISMNDVSTYGRNASGVKLMNLDDNVKIAKVAKVREKFGDEADETDDLDIIS